MIVVPSRFCVNVGKHESPAVKSPILNNCLSLTSQSSPYHISNQSSINSQTSSSFAHYLRTASQNTGKLPYTTQLAHAFPNPASASDPLWTRLRSILSAPQFCPGTLRRLLQGHIGSSPRLSYLRSSGVDLLHLCTARRDCERDLPHFRRILICPPCLDQEVCLQKIALHMLLRDYFFFSIGLLCGTLYLSIKAFLGHYGPLVRALLVVLVLSIPFTKDWIASIVSLQDQIAREAGRICNWL